MQQYLDQATSRVETLQRQHATRTQRVQTLQATLGQKTRQNQKLEREHQRLETNLVTQQQQYHTFTKQIQDQHAQLTELKTAVAALQEVLRDITGRGISTDLIARIHVMEIESGIDLLTRVQTSNALQQTQQAVATLEKQEGHQTQRLRALERKLHKTQLMLQNAKNQRDEVHARAFKTAT